MSGEQRLQRELSNYDILVDLWRGPPIHEDCFAHFTKRELGIFLWLREKVVNRTLCFDMKRISECGTPYCYGGHMAAMVFAGYNDTSPGTGDDFFWNMWFRDKTCKHPEIGYLFSGLNPNNRHELQRALDNYLMTGRGAWPCVLENLVRLLEDEGVRGDLLKCVQCVPWAAYQVYCGTIPRAHVTRDWFKDVMCGRITGYSRC